MSKQVASTGSDATGSAEPLDQEAFAALFSEIYSKLWLIATGFLADRVGADDIVQDAAIVALEKLDQFEPGTNFAAWMAKIVRLKALNVVRRAGRRGTNAADPSTLDRNHASPPDRSVGWSSFVGEAHLGEHQTMFDDQVASALRSLNEPARACLLLRTVEQLSYFEIAEILNLPEGTAMSHVHRAKKAMREQLADYSSQAESSHAESSQARKPRQKT